MESLHYRLKDALDGLADRRIDALVWSGGCRLPRSPTSTTVSHFGLDVSPLAGPMSAISGYAYALHRVPTCRYVLRCPIDRGAQPAPVPHRYRSGAYRRGGRRPATDAAHLVPPDVRGLQYLDTPSMIQTGLIPLHPGALTAYRALHGWSPANRHGRPAPRHCRGCCAARSASKTSDAAATSRHDPDLP